VKLFCDVLVKSATKGSTARKICESAVPKY
jgi:hypothetical protein